jgi:hypothetical protein
MHDRPTGDWRLDLGGPCLELPSVLSGGVERQNRLLSKRPTRTPSLLSILPRLVQYVYITIPIGSSARKTVKIAGLEIVVPRFCIPDKLRRSEYPQAPLDDLTDVEKSYQDFRTKGIESCIQAGGRECRLRGCGPGQDVVENRRSDGEGSQLGKGLGI